MAPQRFPEANGMLGPPAGMPDDQCSTIHVCKTGEYIITAWKPTPEELVKLNLGEPVWLYVMGQCMPPVCLVVDNPFEKERNNDE